MIKLSRKASLGLTIAWLLFLVLLLVGFAVFAQATLADVQDTSVSREKYAAQNETGKVEWNSNKACLTIKPLWVGLLSVAKTTFTTAFAISKSDRLVQLSALFCLISFAADLLRLLDVLSEFSNEDIACMAGYESRWTSVGWFVHWWPAYTVMECTTVFGGLMSDERYILLLVQGSSALVVILPLLLISTVLALPYIWFLFLWTLFCVFMVYMAHKMACKLNNEDLTLQQRCNDEHGNGTLARDLLIFAGLGVFSIVFSYMCVWGSVYWAGGGYWRALDPMAHRSFLEYWKTVGIHYALAM